MNTLVAEARLSLAAAWLLARGDRSGYGLMNLSADGFWRSFAAIFPVLPLYLYSADVGSRLDLAGSAVELPPSPMATVLSLLVQWVTWPILIAAIGRPLGWGANFVRYIVAFNWSSVYVIGVMLPPLMLFDAGVIGRDTMSLLGLASMAAALWMRWIVALTGLQVSGLAAAGLVVAELLLSLGTNWLFE
jgi:hypothetical protein